MSSTGRSQVVDVTYDDPRTGKRFTERRVYEVPYEEIEQIRGQELALFNAPDRRAPRARRDDRDFQDRRAYDDSYYASRPRPRERPPPPAYDRNDDRYAQKDVGRQQERRRDEDRSRRRRDDHSDSDSESSRERRHRRRHRRAKSEHSRAKNEDEDDDDDGRLWYSGRPRKEGKWHERNFDSSYDGIIAGIAGAALGGMTARQFGGQENKAVKMAGGALAGAAAFNLAENKYRLYTEEREEKRERKGKQKHPDEPGLDQPVMLGGQMVAGGMMPGM